MLRLPSVYPGDKTKWPNGQGIITLPQNNDGAKVLLYNETPLNIDLDFENGDTDVIHAWEANYWDLDGSSVELRWQIDNDSINVVSPPIQALYPKFYYPTETLKNKAYPMALVRQLGGASSLTNSNALVNTGSPSGTNIVNVNDPIGTTYTADNDGQWTLSVKVISALIQWLKVQSSDNPMIQLGAANHLLEVLGSIKVDGTSSFDGSSITTDGNGNMLFSNQKQIQEKDNANTTRPILYVDSANITTLRSANGGIQLMNAGGSETDLQMDFATFVNISVAGRLTHIFGPLTVDQLLTATGGISLPAGSINARADVGQTTIAHAGTSVAHSLGRVPTFVIPILDAGGSTTDIISVNYGTMTSTHFTAYTSNATSTGNVRFHLGG